MSTKSIIFIYSTIVAATMLFIGCAKKTVVNTDLHQNIIGSWRLVGIWDADKGELIPFDSSANKGLCELTFLSDKTLQGFTPTHTLDGSYSFSSQADINLSFSAVNINHVMNKHNSEFVDALTYIHSFELNDKGLKLYYMKQFNYLLLMKE